MSQSIDKLQSYKGVLAGNCHLFNFAPAVKTQNNDTWNGWICGIWKHVFARPLYNGQIAIEQAI